MNPMNLSSAVPGEACVQKPLPKCLVLIINRSDKEKAARILREMHCHFLLGCIAQGTIGRSLSDLLGFGQTEKAVILSITLDVRVAATLEELKSRLQLGRPNRGIAFAIPLTGMAPPAHLRSNPEKAQKIQKRMEKGVDDMMGNITHDLILAVVNQGHSQALMEAAQEAGARGGTVLSARHLGAEEATKFLGLPIQGEKEIVAIIAAREAKSAIMERLAAFLDGHPEGQGALLSLPVDSVVGIRD